MKKGKIIIILIAIILSFAIYFIYDNINNHSFVTSLYKFEESVDNIICYEDFHRRKKVYVYGLCNSKRGVYFIKDSSTFKFNGQREEFIILKKTKVFKKVNSNVVHYITGKDTVTVTFQLNKNNELINGDADWSQFIQQGD